ncbi:MAG: 8-oxo-dGTP diphosphatase MutT [Gammaproteobacteria bacterium]|nr:8-oxo-dGTP diphosphatase MutT [Gammaproteobacteria bacterium]
MQHVVIGIILNSDQQVLIAQRLAHQAKSGYWEFPGGKVEANESAFQALTREFKEEIGIDILEAEPWIQIPFHYTHQSVLLDTWLIKKFTGNPVGAEGQPIQWVKISELSQFKFPEGNDLIIEKLLNVNRGSGLTN